MPDNIDLLYEALKNNPTIKGLPEDINTFRSALNTEGLPNKLFQALKENPTIKGLPEDYSSFEGALGLKKKATSTGFGSGLAPSPVTSSAFAPVPGMGTYKEKSKPEEESPFQFGKQLLAVGASGSRRATANVLSIPEFIYDAAGAPFRKIGLDVPKYDDLSQGTIAKYVNDYIQGTEKTVEQIKKDAKIDPQVEKGIIDNISKGNYSKAFQSAGLGIAESLPAMFLMALTPSAGAGAGIGGQVARQTFMAAPFMAGKYQEIADDPTMSESAKIMNSIVNGYAETIFEDKFGSLALIRDAKKIMAKQGIEAAKDFTKKGFIDAVEKGMEKYFIVTAPVLNAIEEGATQLTQNFSSKMTGEKPDLDLLDGVPEAMAQGGAFGLGISAIPATSDAKKWVNKKLLSNVAVSDNKDLIVPVLIQKIKDGVDAGTITQEEADAALNDLDLLVTNSQKVPANINREEKANAVEILNDRNRLENLLAQREAAAANLDPAFKDTKATEIADIKAQIEEKNQLLKNIGNGEAPVSAEQATTDIEAQKAVEELTNKQTEDATKILLPSVPEFEKQMEEKYGIILDLLDYKGGILQLSKIIVNKEDRGSGIGKKVMQEIVDYADKFGKKITLTPSTDFGATSVNRLKAFYKEFGFVENSGKNKDYSTKETMYRQPIDNKKINETTKPTENATKISKEPITQGGEQGSIVQREGAQEGQPQAGQREGGTGETTQPEADNRNRPISSEEEQKVVVDTKQQIQNFGVKKDMVEPVNNVIGNLFEGLKKAGLTAAKNIGEWVNIGKGEEKPYSLKINGNDVQVKNVNAEVIDGFYSPIEKIINDSKQDKLPTKQWIEKYANSEEAQFTGLKDWLAQQEGSVSKADIQQFLKDNRINVVEVVNRQSPDVKESDLRVIFDGDGFSIDAPDKGVSRIYVGLDELSIDYNGENYKEVEDAAIQDGLSQIRNSKRGDNTRYSQYQLEGEKENYKEILVTLPPKGLPDGYEIKKRDLGNGIVLYRANGDGISTSHESYQDAENELKYRARELYGTGKLGGAKFKSTHFDELDILVHLRMNTRTDSEGNKVLFLEEVQSDWGQIGKKEGFKQDFTAEEKEFLTLRELLYKGDLSKEQGDRYDYLFDKVGASIVKNVNKGKTPTAPFVTDTNAWTKLGLKVALKEAVKQGVDKIAWTTGEQQNERYDLSKSVDYVRNSGKTLNGDTYIDISLPGGLLNLHVNEKGIVTKQLGSMGMVEAEGKRLDDIIGKDIAERILLSEANTKLEGEGLKIGGKGMKGFYGSPTEGSLGIVGNVAKKLFKQEPKTTEIEISRTDQFSESYNSGAYTIVEYNTSNGKKEKAFNNEEDAEEFKKGLISRQFMTQYSVDITPELKATVGEGQPLFKDADAQYRIESGKNIIEAIKKFNGKPKAVIALTHEIMHPTVVAIIEGAKQGNEIGLKHSNTIIAEYNKANPDNQITLDQMMADNDAFKEGNTTDAYRSMQEFIAESWEKYHYEGKQGFSKAFQEVLDIITEAFRKVYKSLKGDELTPELKAMFDDLLSEEPEVTQESKQEPIKKRAFIDIQEIKDKYPNLYKSLTNKSLRYTGANKLTLSNIRNLLVEASQKFFNNAGSATDYLNTFIDIENILETLYEPNAENITKEQFKKRIAESKDFTKNELGIFNALIDTLNTDQMPTYLLDQEYIKRLSGRSNANFYAFSKNIIVSKQANAFVHEIGHFAYYNILSKEDRINYLKYMISTTYDTPNSKGKSIESRLAKTSDKNKGFTTNVADNFGEYFAEQFSQWYLNKKVFPKDIEYIFRKVQYFLAKVIEKIISGKYVDENLSDYFNKIVGDIDKIRKENKLLLEAKAKPEVPTELTKLEEKYNKDKKSLTKKELNDVLEIKRERRKKAMASLEKGNLSEEEVAIKKAAMQKLTDTMVEIIALIDKGKFKKVEGDKEPTIKQKIKAVNEAGTTKTKAMTFSEYMRDRKRSFEEGYKKGTKDRAAQEQYRKAMLNVAIEYLASKKLGKLKEAALRSLIRAAAKVSNMSKLETFIKRVDLIMAKADFIEKYNEAKTLKKELDTNKKGGATQLIQRLKNINLDYLPESGIDKVIAIAKELNSKRPDMSTVIPNMKEVLDLEEAGFREAMRANYGELGLLGGSISKFMDNEEIYKNLKKLIEYQLISKEQVSEVELENAKTVLRNKLEEAYKKIKDFVDNKKTIDNLGEYLDIKKAIKAYNRTVRQIDQVMPEFAQKFELLTDADNEISQRLGKEIETSLKEFKEEVIKVSLNTSANLREYALSDAFKEESGLSPELNEILSNHLANFANNMDRETMNDLSVEDIADYTFFAEQALLGYISPEIYETYSKVGAIKAKNDTMQDLESVMESDSKLQRDIAKINANYKGAKSKEDFVKIMTEYRKHNVDSFLGSGAVSLFYNNVYFPFGTNVTRMRAIIADLTSDFLKLDDEMNGISLSYGIPSPKILGGKKVIAATKIGKLLGSDKSIEDVKNTIMILLQQLDFITNLENPEKAKEKVYFDAFINNKEKRDALIRGAKDEQGMKDLIKSYENAIEIISKLQSAIKDKNKTLSEKAAGLITSKTAETLSKTTDAGVTLETISGVEEILNELANSNPVVKAYIDVIRKTISSFEAYTEMNTMMKGEQYYSLPNYMARQYVSGNLNTVSTSDKTAQLLKGSELFQRIKKNSSATYSREGDGLKPRIINPKSSLMMHANDVMMEYSLKGIMEASLDGIALAEQQATTKGEKDFLAACKESMNLMLETEFVTSKTEGVSKMALELLNLQTTLLVGNALRQPADYGGNLIKVGTSVDGAKVLINNIKEQLGTLQLLENGNSNLKELQERDKAAYELASMLGGEFLWAESERKASQISGNISGEQVMGNKTIKLAWADRLIVSNVYLPLFIKYFEQSAKKKFNPKEFNENPQKYYLDNLKALQTATREADKFIAKTHVSKNPLTKPEIVSLLGMKLKRDAVSTRLLFSLTGYNANDSEVIKSILMDLYYGNGNRGLKLAQLAGRVSRSSVSNVAYMASYKIIFGTLSVLIQSGIGFFDDDDDKEFAKVLLKEWEEFYQQYLTKEGLQQDLLGSIATMLTGQYQNIVRPIVNVSLFAAMKAGLLGKNTKMSEEKYKKIIRSTRSANFFTKQYAPKYDVPMVMVNEAAGLIGLSYVASMAAENAMTIGKTLSTEGKAKNIDFIAATTAGLQLANASAMLMGVGYGSGTYNKVSDQVRSVVREEQRKQKPSKVQSIQSLLRPRSTIKKFNPLKP